MTSVGWVLAATVTLALSGVPGLFGSARSLAGQRLAVGLLVAGSVLGWIGVVVALQNAAPDRLSFDWFLPIGRFAVGLDALSALFLAPVFVVPALGAVFGLGYWKQSEHPANGRKLSAFYGLLAAAMTLVVVSADAVLFLIAWEIMALAGYFAMTTEDDDPGVCRAGWIYLVFTHLGTLCLIAMFLLWHGVTGDWSLDDSRQAIAPEAANAIFVLALIGFGCKAGLMPLHGWVPGADACAPCHVAAVKSGVMQKMGLYGILRITAVLGTPPVWWGVTLLSVGVITGVLGIAFAIGQRDLKRLLAYSSIENIGIVAVGMGLALLGRSCDRPEWVLLGLAGALLHVWNHSLFKSLLFLNVGVIDTATGTHDVERLGGLAKSMPRSAALYFIGAWAICALPPLNGFTGEWLMYVGLFHTLVDGPQSLSAATGAWAWAGLCAAALALMGALAVACFVKLFGTVFLGTPRDAKPTVSPRDPGAVQGIPMTLLAAACVTAGLAPWLAAPWLEQAAGAWWFGSRVGRPLLTLAPLHWLTVMGSALAVGAGMIGWLLWRGLRNQAMTAGTWSCGYAQPTPRIQYTGSSFGQTLVGLFGWALWPRTLRPRIRRLFAEPAQFQTEQPDTVLDRLMLPVFRLANRFLPWLRLTQQGLIQVYVAYFVAAVLLLIFWSQFGIES